MPTGNVLDGARGTVHPATNVSKPNNARIYNYLLGGKDHFAADRDEAERMLQAYPPLVDKVRENRLFVERAVSWLAAQGIRQFVDIGSGMPAEQNTHQIAQAVDPACRVTYVDYDPVVACHARALLRADGVTVIEADLRDPVAIISHPEVEQAIWSGEPLGIILSMVLHFVEAQAASQIMRALVRAIPRGSHVAISVGSADEQTGARLAREHTAAPLYNHAPGQIARFFDGLELVGPGLVDAEYWEPLGTARPPTETGGYVWAGIARKA